MYFKQLIVDAVILVNVTHSLGILNITSQREVNVDGVTILVDYTNYCYRKIGMLRV